MSHHKAAGKARQHKRPAGKRLGLKMQNQQKISEGKIIVRQRGTKFQPGDGVSMGRDHTLFAIKSGVLKFSNRLGKKIISVK